MGNIEQYIEIDGEITLYAETVCLNAVLLITVNKQGSIKTYLKRDYLTVL